MSTLNFNSKDSGDLGRSLKQQIELQNPENQENEYLSKEKLLVINLLFTLNHFIKDFKRYEEKLQSLADKDSFTEELKAFRSLLLELQEQDLSHQIDFASKLSYAWHAFADHLSLTLRHNRKLPFYQEGSLLVESILHYPPDGEYSLGYYLSQYAGEKWIPFPFMNILQALHEEHASDPKGSHLEVWTQTISNLIEIFTKSVVSSLQVDDGKL
jgi:hypothetical protein